MKELNLLSKIKFLSGIILMTFVACSLLVTLNPLIPLLNLQLSFTFVLLVLFSNLISTYVYRFMMKREGLNENSK